LPENLVPFQPPAGVTLVEHPLIQVKLTTLRDRQTGAEVFRRTLGELSTLMAFSVARDFETLPIEIDTPLQRTSGHRLTRPVILAPILRAGLGMVEGMARVLSDVSIGHIGLFRNEETLRPESYYFKLPAHLSSAEVLVVDPMLATGWSATAAVEQLKKNGATRVRFVCLVSCPQGLQQLRSAHPEVPIYTGAIDESLDARGYIIPGLGDAGDRYFGTFG
jgi:uracil phosphoribosyltransferase